MKDTVVLGSIGVTSTWGSVAVSMASHALAGMQFLSLLLGIIIGCWTLYRMWKLPTKPDDK